MTSEPDTFASRVQRLMVANGHTQTSIADESGIDRSAINRMLKGSRQPSPFEIGLLAQCFNVSPDDLMAGLQLPPQVQRAVDKERERTQRVLAAEAARDEAIARADQLAIELEWLQLEREREQEAARKAAASADVKWAERLLKAEGVHAAEQQTSDTTIRTLKGMLERAAARMREHQATEVALRNQTAALQQQVAQERSTKAGASVLSGLVGIALGRAMD